MGFHVAPRSPGEAEVRTCNLRDLPEVKNTGDSLSVATLRGRTDRPLRSKIRHWPLGCFRLKGILGQDGQGLGETRDMRSLRTFGVVQSVIHGAL
mmetsp:Transcript_28228/g.65366  ORF Transcript_28228/g.65366 Transcript_28228/m.65366 type:complete len:95 (+) Transcript_28228:4169-4453(+)